MTDLQKQHSGRELVAIAERLRMVRRAHERFVGLAALECIMDHTTGAAVEALGDPARGGRANPQVADRSAVFWGGSSDDE